MPPKVCAKQHYEEEHESEAEYMEDESQGDDYMADESQDEPIAELLKLYNIKIEKTNAENNKASLQAQGGKGPTGNQPITIEEEEVTLPKKIKKTHPENQKTAEVGKKQSKIGNEGAAEAQ
ncbi:hypothetical protein PIB30_084465 [Stylosanthes scabra]|uniref:Uncharacterized protein n=1 Tax=Stylosanthes scabra TaxID=79078 RepID=A0ABU6XS66_9FABA|nr:hypothetical protein [Stylosanthes scabra]